MRTVSTAAILMLVALAGCVESTPGGGDDPPPAKDPCVLGPFDHADTRIVNVSYEPFDDERQFEWDHESTAVRTCSLPAIGRSLLRSDGVPHKYIGEIDMRGDLDLGAVAVLGNGEAPRAYLLNISDRANPEVLSFIDQAGTYMTDIKITDDGMYLYTASQGTPGTEIASMQPQASGGFTVYDIRDRASPRYLGTVVDSGTGCHMLSVVQVASNQDAVFCIASVVRSYLIQRDGSGLINLGFVDYAPAPDASGAPEGPHDLTVFHEGQGFGDGRSYQIVSHWGEGVKVLDITDSPVVTEVGSWTGQGATHFYGNVHTAMMFVVGQDRYIVASPELTNTGAEQVPSMWVLDANDLGALKLVGEWYHPGAHPAYGLYQTTHQWQVAPTGPDVSPDDVRVYLTYNHVGVWVLDFSKMLDKDLAGAILGFNTAREPLDQDAAVSNARLNTWDVNVVDGYIYGSDRATGLWVFHYQDDVLGDERLRGFA